MLPNNRRNSEHKKLMQEGKLIYKIIGEFEKEEDARTYEDKLIQKYMNQKNIFSI
jgi:hypothetical protein